MHRMSSFALAKVWRCWLAGAGDASIGVWRTELAWNLRAAGEGFIILRQLPGIFVNFCVGG